MKKRVLSMLMALVMTLSLPLRIDLVLNASFF